MENLKTKIQELESIDDLDLLIQGDVIRAEFETYSGSLMFIEKSGGEYVFANNHKGVKLYFLVKEGTEIKNKGIKSKENSGDEKVLCFNHNQNMTNYLKIKEMLDKVGI
jgi:hypothetical protein